MNDLTEIESTGDINNPMVIRSIESKLPDDMKIDWLTFMLNPANNVTPDSHFDSLLKYLKTQEAILEKLDQMSGKETTGKEDYLPKERRMCCLWQ